MNLRDVQVFAWMGEDELGSGEIGMKQVMLPGVGLTNLCSVEEHKLHKFTEGLQAQANRYGKTITLVRMQIVEELIVIEPKG